VPLSSIRLSTSRLSTSRLSSTRRTLLAGVLAALAIATLGPRSTSPASAVPTTSGTLSATSSGTLSSTSSSAPSTNSNWTVYHHDALGSGVDSSGVTLTGAHPAWTSPALDGALFGEPLVEGSVVFVATENDTVYALAAASGAVVWSTHLGTPVPSSQLPCGDITPTLGITGTPVIDPARSEIFAVADEEINGAPAHTLVGLGLASGNILLNQNVDPPGASTPALLQRTGLNLSNGNVVFGFGGNYGDCSTYHGWVMGVPEAGGTVQSFEFDAASGEHEGAVWMGGAAPEVDASGNIWLAAGNGSVESAGAQYDNSDSVVELSPQFQLAQIFSPSNWPSDNANDRDLGSSSPVLLGSGLVVQAGKSQTGYLLDMTHLGGVGGQVAAVSGICNGDVDGGHAVSGTIAYLPCVTGVIALRVAATTISVVWTTPSGAGGPPIVVDGMVWSISRSGQLVALDPNTGAVVQQFALGSEANHFPTPAVGDGLLLAPSANQVHAFAGTPTTTTTTTPPSTSSPSTAPSATTGPSHHGGASSGGLGAGALAGIAAGGLVAILGVGALVLRRRRHLRARTLGPSGDPHAGPLAGPDAGPPAGPLAGPHEGSPPSNPR
jgi:outer membrane protein assembly factor BamB